MGDDVRPGRYDQALRLKYVPVVSQVLPGRKAATFFQLDRRLNMIVDLQLFSQIPLAHVKEQDVTATPVSDVPQK